MVRMEKKGQMQFDLTRMIVVVVGFLVIVGLIFFTTSNAEAKEPELICEESVAFRAASAVEFAGQDIKYAPILCKTEDEVVSGSQEEVLEEFADSMASCWQMFGEGRYKNDVFSSMSIFQQNSCFVCNTLLIEDIKADDGDEPLAGAAFSFPFGVEEEGGSISTDEFLEYIIEEEHPKLDEVSYLDYFQSYAGDGRIVPIFSGEEVDGAVEVVGIEEDRAYAIAFGSRTSSCDFCDTLFGGGVATTALGVAAFAYLPVGGTLALYTIGAGGVATVVGGTGVFSDVFGDVLYADDFVESRDVSTVYVVDITNSAALEDFGNSCAIVPEYIR